MMWAIVEGLALWLVPTLGSWALFHRLRLGKHAAKRNRTRTMRLRIRFHRKPGPGFVSMSEMVLHWSRMRAVFDHGRNARPESTAYDRLLSHPSHYAAPLGRAHWAKRVWAPMEDLMLVLSPPRAGKSVYLALRVLLHPGPCLVTSTKADMYALTAALRAHKGPVYVLNPAMDGGIKSNFRFDLCGPCEDPDMACRMASWLQGREYQGTGDMAFWQNRASVALAALLHAAALGRKSLVDVISWVARQGDDLAERLLRTDPRANRVLLAKLLEIMKDSKPSDSVRMTIGPALDWLAVPALADAVEPGEGSFTVEDFITGNATVFMIAGGDDTPVAPLFAAIAGYLHYRAGLIASNRERGRLSPPLLMALDEVTQICPVPLARWAADSGGKGITLVAVIHGFSQLAERWGEHGGRTIMNCCSLWMILGGVSDHDTLERISKLFGSVAVTDPEGEVKHLAVLPPEVIRQLPKWRALVVRGNHPPVVVRIERTWRRRDVRKAARLPQPGTVFAVPGSKVHANGHQAEMPPTAPLPVLESNDLVTSVNGNGKGPHHG